MTNNCDAMDSHLSCNSEKIVIFDNGVDGGLAPRIARVASLVRKQRPNAGISCVVKEVDGIADKANLPYHVYTRKSPCSVSEGINLALRVRRMKPDIILMRKHDITLKFFFLSLMCRSAKLHFWKIHADTELSLSRMKWGRFLIRRFTRVGFMRSLICSSLPLLLLLVFLPFLWLKRCSSAKKRQIWGILKGNLQQGPLGDSPWLWASLQFVMFWAFLCGDKPRSKCYSRILVIRNDHIGDAISTVPLVRYLRRKYPEAKITVLCDTGQFLWESCPYVDELLIYKTNNKLFRRKSGQLRYALRPFTYMWTLRKKRFDVVFDPVGRTETHIMSYLCRNTVRFSNTCYPYRLFGIGIGCRHYESVLHETQRALSLVKSVDEIRDEERALEIWLEPQIENWADRFLEISETANRGRILGIHPGAVSPLRLWPLERFAMVASELARKHGMQSMFFEPPGRFDLTREFSSALAAQGHKPLVVRGVDLLSLAALIARCDLFLCNDSGPMHLGAAARTPLIAIFGPGEYVRWQPLHSDSAIVRHAMTCSPCSQNDCTHPKCILEVTTEDVLQAAEKLLLPSPMSRPARA